MNSLEVEMHEIESMTPTRRVPLMAEFAIVSTLLLIAAPIVLVGATLAAAARKRLARGGDLDARVARR